jgi:hypothetical protein
MYNSSGKKSGLGLVYFPTNDISDTKRIASGSKENPYQVRAPKDYIEQYYVNGKPNGSFKFHKFKRPDDICPTTLIVGKKQNGKPIGCYKIYTNGKLTEMGDAQNFVKQTEADAYDYILDRTNNSEEFLVSFNERRTSMRYRNYNCYHSVIIENARWKMLKLGQEMFDFDSVFLFNFRDSNQLSFSGTVSWRIEQEKLKIQCSDGVDYDKYGRLSFSGFSEYDFSNRASKLGKFIFF